MVSQQLSLLPMQFSVDELAARTPSSSAIDIHRTETIMSMEQRKENKKKWRRCQTPAVTAAPSTPNLARKARKNYETSPDECKTNRFSWRNQQRAGSPTPATWSDHRC
eukprot:2347501-Rhodomonas_salina.1